MCKESFIFYSLLSIDGEALERACSEVADLGRWAGAGAGTRHSCDAETPASSSTAPFPVLRDALIGLSRRKRLLAAGAGRERVMCTYVEEAELHAAKGNGSAALRFLGRALEVRAGGKELFTSLLQGG